MNELVALASDHAGCQLREYLSTWLEDSGYRVLDLGPPVGEAVDYPIYAKRLARVLLEQQAERGILVCGTGIGMSMAANRFVGIRAALCTDGFMAQMARAHNDANVLCLGARVVGFGLALNIAELFLKTPFAGGRHSRRVGQLLHLED